MYQSQITVRYAKSLFLLAKEKNMLDEIKRDILLIYDTLNSSVDLNNLLEHPVIKPSEKIEALGKIFKTQINPVSFTFLQLLVNNKREGYLKRISQNFIDIYKKNENIHSAVLTTAYELSVEEKQNIKKAIEGKANATFELSSTVDESIIGGMILQIDDKELDVSVLKQLQRLRTSLLELDLNSKQKKKN